MVVMINTFFPIPYPIPFGPSGFSVLFYGSRRIYAGRPATLGLFPLFRVFFFQESLTFRESRSAAKADVLFFAGKRHKCDGAGARQVQDYVVFPDFHDFHFNPFAVYQLSYGHFRVFCKTF